MNATGPTEMIVDGVVTPGPVPEVYVVYLPHDDMICEAIPLYYAYVLANELIHSMTVMTSSRPVSWSFSYDGQASYTISHEQFERLLDSGDIIDLGLLY